MNYKSGDLVKIAGNNNNHDFSMGEIVRLKHNCGGEHRVWVAEYLDGHDFWYVLESDMKPYKPTIMPQKIVITTDGKTTLARLFDGKTMVKRAEAKCAPSDTFNFNTGANLAFNRLVYGTDYNPQDVVVKAKPAAAESNPEPVKLYCVNGYEPFFTQGRVYEFDSGRIKMDNRESRFYESIDDLFLKNVDFKSCLFPLVRRPAKAGEWVIAASSDGHRAKLNVPYAVSRVGKSNPDWVYVVADSDDTCIRDDQYLVLDGYHGDSE